MELIRAKQTALEQQLQRMSRGKQVYDKLDELARERDTEIFQVYQNYQLREEEAFSELRSLGCDVPDDTLALNGLDFNLDGEAEFTLPETSQGLLTPPDSAGIKSELPALVEPITPSNAHGRKRGAKPKSKISPRAKAVKRNQQLSDCKIGDHLENAATIVLSPSGWVELRCSYCGGNSISSNGNRGRYVSGIAGLKMHIGHVHGGKHTNANVMDECTVRSLSNRDVEKLRSSARYDPVPRFPLSSVTKIED